MADILRPPSSDEGEISDASNEDPKNLVPRSPDYEPQTTHAHPHSSQPPKAHHRRPDDPLSLKASEDKEAQLRSKLLARRGDSVSSQEKEKKPKKSKSAKRFDPDGDSDRDENDLDLLQVQPKKEHKIEKPPSERDRDKRDRRDVHRSEARRHEHARPGHRDRHPERRAERPPGSRRHDEPEGLIAKHRKRELEKEREKERKQKEKEKERQREKEKERRRQKRSRSASNSSEDEHGKKPRRHMSSGDGDATEHSVQDEEEAGEIEEPSPKQDLSNPSPQPQRPKYSKFDSESDDDGHRQLDGSPTYSPPIFRKSDDDESDVEMDEEQEGNEAVDEVDDGELSFDPTQIPFDELTSEQKAQLSPDYLKDLERSWQQSLILQLPPYYAGILGCRNVREFDCINKVAEGTYGVVYRAKCKRTEEVVALKRLKMDKERDGFPITALREINMLLKAKEHENILRVREIVVGDNIDKIFLVMDFIEHDLKSLMETMSKRNKQWEIGHVKTLMKQLISGVAHLHSLWILHRDLKTSNLLLNHQGILKIADFGLAREYCDPLVRYTEVVVTLWYRAPELLLGTKLYSTPIDMWSVGCIMAEFIRLQPLWPGKGEGDQIKKIFLDLGTPKVDKWPGIVELELWKKLELEHYPNNQLRKKFKAEMLNQTAWVLINSLLTYNPELRMTADEALKSKWFEEDPLPLPPEDFPTFPAKSEGGKVPKRKEPEAPKLAAKQIESLGLDNNTRDLLLGLKIPPKDLSNGGFALKFDEKRF